MSGAEPSPGAPLRVGLLVDSMSVPAWLHRTVSLLEQDGVAKVVLVVRNRLGAAPSPGVRHGLCRLYRAIDRRLFRLRDDALAPADLRELLPGVPEMEMEPFRGKRSDFLRSEDAERLRAEGLDVVLHLGFLAPRGEFLNIARYGVWSFRFGPDPRLPERPPGLWEVLEASPTTAVSLCALQEDGGSHRVLYHSHGPTDHISAHRNANNCLWKAAHFPARCMRDLRRGGGEVTLDRQRPTGYRPVVGGRGGIPANLRMAGLLLRLAGRYLLSKLRHLRGRDQWYLAYRFLRRPGDWGDDFRDMKRLVPPRDRFWADPFVLEREGLHYCFVEELPYATGRGHISVIPFDAEGRPGPVSRVLELDCHLSYPFVFEWQGTHYMIPEMSESRRVTLFRCERWPDRWVEDRVLLEGSDAVDATLLEHGGRWWMFVNIGETGTRNWDELHIFQAPSPLGPWEPHQANPVRSDCRAARPAGRFFQWGGELFRPAQICAGSYGAAIRVHRVLRLDKDAYEEETVSEIRPDWDPQAERTHTLNRTPGMLVVDLLRRRPLWEGRREERPGHIAPRPESFS